MGRKRVDFAQRVKDRCLGLVNAEIFRSCDADVPRTPLHTPRLWSATEAVTYCLDDAITVLMREVSR